MTRQPEPAINVLARELPGLGWVSDLFVAGSLAAGDYRPGVSDLDLVAVCEGPIDAARREALERVHRGLDRSVAAGLGLGCAYLDAARVNVPDAVHLTWTHGGAVDRRLTAIVRVELVTFGYAVFGRRPGEVFPDVTRDDVRAAGRSEVADYWRRAARRPWWWWPAAMTDLSLTAMARNRHVVRHGELLTKSASIDHLAAPPWLVEQVRARRDGHDVRSPRLRAAAIAWADTARTVRVLGRDDPARPTP